MDCSDEDILTDCSEGRDKLKSILTQLYACTNHVPSEEMMNKLFNDMWHADTFEQRADAFVFLVDSYIEVCGPLSPIIPRATKE